MRDNAAPSSPQRRLRVLVVGVVRQERDPVQALSNVLETSPCAMVAVRVSKR